MTAGGFYDRARAIIADPELAGRRGQARRGARQAAQADQEGRPAARASRQTISELQATLPARASAIRCRSSTNNEDLEGFNGAGLYDSYTHRPDEGDLSKTVKQVWASLWNLRAFDEREFHRIDHLAAAMGVLVHPNFDDEVANGVAVTKNPFDPNWPGFYVNVQVGECSSRTPTRTRRPTSCSSRRSAPTASTRRSTSAARR